MRALVILLSLWAVGCGEPEADIVSSAVPASAPPPVLTVSELEPGQRAFVRADGLPPGAQVWFARAGRLGAGPCVAAAGGVCLDIQGGISVMGTAVADARGAARLTFTVPAAAPVGAGAWFQAIAAQGGVGTKTAPVRAEIGSPVDLCAEAQTVFNDMCVDCHGEQASGGLDLRDATAVVGREARGAFLRLVDTEGSPAERLERSYLWRKVSGTHLDVGGSGARMPLWGVLTDEEVAPVRAWIEAGAVCDPDDEPTPVDAAADVVPMHRLNRAEYDNTVRDLLGTSLRPAQGFPADDAVVGFDNVAAALNVSSLHAEVYEAASEALAIEFIDRFGVGGPDLNNVDVLRQGEGPEMTATVGGVSTSSWCLWSVGNLSTVVNLPSAGTYRMVVAAWASQGGPDLARMELRIDGVSRGTFNVSATDPSAPGVHAVEVSLPAGAHELTARFTNDYYDAVNGIDRNLFIDWIQMIGPVSAPQAGVLDGSALGARYADGLTCEPQVDGAEDCLTRLLGPLARRAWRRPVEPDELDDLVVMAASLIQVDGLPYRDAAIAGVQALLLSPDFLFRPEPDRNGPLDPAPQPLSEHELASRLSYFLWSSMPDDTLLALADAGQLSDPSVLVAQVHRMLEDSRSDALFDNFAGQWLWLRSIPNAAPDAAMWPGWTDSLQRAFSEEARRLFTSFVHSPRPMTELLTARSVEVNDEIAAWYGAETIPGGWALTDLSSVDRHGILTNGGLIAALSNPTRSNPVRRGRFILEQLLCSNTGDPPPGVIALFDPTAGEGSLRDRFESHRADPICASCHDSIDPLGFSLEGFGPSGQSRELDDLGYPVDTLGEMQDGRTFVGAAGLAETVAGDPRFPLCLSEKMFVYALGQEISVDLYGQVQDVRDQLVAGGMSFEELAAAIVLSPAFTERGE